MNADVNRPGYAPPPGGTSRMDVVKKHLIRVVRAMEAVPGSAFGICLFNNNEYPTPQLGSTLWPATKSNVERAVAAIERIEAGGANGGEARCLETCIRMAPAHDCTRLRATQRCERWRGSMPGDLHKDGTCTRLHTTEGHPAVRGRLLSGRWRMGRRRPHGSSTAQCRQGDDSLDSILPGGRRAPGDRKADWWLISQDQ